ncbi:ATPase, T2SS/T4P/T4SS family [Pseudomonas aeruginosa]
MTARDLIRNALRMRPDRIILGEIRGVEVLDVLQAMNTGHDGSMSTVHASSAMDSLLRMEMLVGLTGNRLPEPDLAPDDLRRAGRGGADHPPGRRSALHQRSAGGAGGARRRVRHQYPVQSRPAR